MTLQAFRGRRALSPFRITKIRDALNATRSNHAVESLTATWWHFVEATRPLNANERETLDRLLTYGPRESDRPGGAAATLVVVPRPGTISPWSSKATNIAHNCGLAAVDRIERGVVFDVATRSGRLDADDRAALLPIIHDRMVEVVLDDLDTASTLFQLVSPKPLLRIPLSAAGKAALERANRELGLALSAEEIDYLDASYRALDRDPTDVELLMFAQANSEHCRHKIFNAEWTIDGRAQQKSLFGMIRDTHAASPKHTIVAYADNASIIEGSTASRFYPDPTSGEYGGHTTLMHAVIKVETHNHPTAIAPYPGAATGSGGEIRDEGATGVGAKPKAGLTGFTVSNLRIPTLLQPWETTAGMPDRIASPLAIMLEGPIGAAAFNNEFGRPNLVGYFRTFEQQVAGEWRGYHKPIMIAGGVGSIDARHAQKRALEPGALLIQLGGPGLRIGIGGGAASSMSTGANTADLDFDSVQRDNAEMQRRAQEVIDACWRLGEANPIGSIHDVGAGGLSNAFPELVHGAHVGGRLDLRAIPVGASGMSPREIWCNEAQERYVLAISPGALPAFRSICERERCPYAVVGTTTEERKLVVTDARFDNHPVDVPLDVILGKPPRMMRSASRVERALEANTLDDVELRDAVYRVLQLPAVADKTFLVTIGDRTVGGLCARDPMVGPWQVPVADVGVTLADFDCYRGEAMAIGERTPLALIDGPASGRMAVAEALTNLMAAPVASLAHVKLSANWMAPAGHPGEDATLFDTVRAVRDFCIALGVSIPVGKDSMSMRTTWRDARGDHAVTAPVSLIVSAFAAADDVRSALTPLLRLDDGETALVLLDASDANRRLGGSALAQVFGQLGERAPDVAAERVAAMFSMMARLRSEGTVLAYHDISDGGLLATLVEMAFASRCALELALDGIDAPPLSALFAEEIGAVVQIRSTDVKALLESARGEGLRACVLGVPVAGHRIRIRTVDGMLLDESRIDLHRAWSSTTHAMQRLRDLPSAAQSEYDRLLDADEPPMPVGLTFEPAEDIAAPFIATGVRPRVAILREQGVNGQVEMAAAFTRAGFSAIDIHMSDILSGRCNLADVQGLAACGGFSFGDVLGAGEGWAKSILFNARARDEFSAFFSRPNTFALGLCNGCQMMSNLHALIPGASHWPRFVRNRSEQYEARLALVEVQRSPSLFFASMAGSRIPIATAHGEGFAEFNDAAQRAAAQPFIALRFVDAHGNATERYPFNPNGSPEGIAGLTTPDGRFSILMPHPERVFRSVQMSWRPASWGEDSPWMRMFRNARVWLG
ncbi:MAG TPA: phosphoribosylformylglycinamidine synthase [Casimicrobiaceae bacterium]|nr:phosphoribosylformylglycinamidine synthase [Casimicrobiaceae bacterium]